MYDDEILEILEKNCDDNEKLIKFTEELFRFESSDDKKYNKFYDNLIEIITKDD